MMKYSLLKHFNGLLVVPNDSSVVHYNSSIAVFPYCHHTLAMFLEQNDFKFKEYLHK